MLKRILITGGAGAISSALRAGLRGVYPVRCKRRGLRQLQSCCRLLPRRAQGEESPRPDGRYGAPKIFGKALGRLYADKHGLSVACLCIGSFRERLLA